MRERASECVCVRERESNGSQVLLLGMGASGLLFSHGGRRKETCGGKIPSTSYVHTCAFICTLSHSFCPPYGHTLTARQPPLSHLKPTHTAKRSCAHARLPTLWTPPRPLDPPTQPRCQHAHLVRLTGRGGDDAEGGGWGGRRGWVWRHSLDGKSFLALLLPHQLRVRPLPL